MNVVTRQPIKCQTAVHTMSLILGCLDVADEAMARYLAHRSLSGQLARVYPVGRPVNMLAPEVRTIVWSPDRSELAVTGGARGVRLRGGKIGKAAVTWQFEQPESGVDVSGGELRIRYRNRATAIKAVVSLERPAADGRSVSQEIFVTFRHTLVRAQELRIPLPATPSLLGIKKVTLMIGSGTDVKKVDLSLLDFRVRHD
jgi:hypothetical protein